jgi:hypothetical protein
MSIADSGELATPAPPQRAVILQKPRANIYTAMLAVSLVAIIIGCVFLALELGEYDWQFNAGSIQ